MYPDRGHAPTESKDTFSVARLEVSLSPSQPQRRLAAQMFLYPRISIRCYLSAMSLPFLSRREFVRRAAMLGAALSFSRHDLFANPTNAPLQTFAYADVTLNSDLHRQQLTNTHTVL